MISNFIWLFFKWWLHHTILNVYSIQTVTVQAHVDVFHFMRQLWVKLHLLFHLQMFQRIGHPDIFLNRTAKGCNFPFLLTDRKVVVVQGRENWKWWYVLYFFSISLLFDKKILISYVLLILYPYIYSMYVSVSQSIIYSLTFFIS